MRFTISTVGSSYDNEKERTYLETLGFKFSQRKSFGDHWIIDDDHLPEIEINTIKDLVEIIDNLNEHVIVSRNHIKIYDGYVE